MATDLQALLTELARFQVEFIVVGGIAARLHGSARLTEDIDLVYSRRKENLERLARCLAPHQPYPRGAPPGLPFQWDTRTLSFGLNFTLTTKLGDIDLLGEIAGGGSYEDLLPHTMEVRLFGEIFRCVDLPTLIRVKRAAGRPKDFEVIAELESILEEQEREGTS